MLSVPIRLLAAARPTVRLALLAALGVSTVVFSATPFLLPEIADEFSVSIGAASAISTVQLAGFVFGSWGAGRFITPGRVVLPLGLVILAGANLASAFAPGFVLLLGTRAIAGVSLGLVAWLAWSEAFGDTRRTGDVAVVGPIIGVVASPPLAWVASEFGPRWLYGCLAGLALVALLIPPGASDDGDSESAPRNERSRSKPVPAARLLLVALFLFTMGGSAVFVFGVVIGTEQAGLTAGVVALAFSANACAGIPSARFSGERTLPWLWMALTGCCAFIFGMASGAIVFFATVMVWGFSYWMGVPGVFALLAERSANPADRAGDAQAMMAAGRVLGPIVGGFAFEAASTTVLGIVGGTAMAAGAGLVALVSQDGKD